jgi:hypothetical protein
MNEAETLGAETLHTLSKKLFDELNAANNRLRQPVSAKDVVAGIRRVAKLGDEACLLLQPGFSGGAWSDRKIPLVFLAQQNGVIRVRIRRGRSYRNSGATPAVWKELRGFPRGDVSKKLKSWSDADDGDGIPNRRALGLTSDEISCKVSEWKPPYGESRITR